MMEDPLFTPLEKATDEAGGEKNIDADPVLLNGVRERSSLTGFTNVKEF